LNYGTRIKPLKYKAFVISEGAKIIDYPIRKRRISDFYLENKRFEETIA